ncbi:helix-turn-helix domain-containing protein, partial [Methylobacterium sp. J-030]|uniref:helix-turn-helix domain-containing protein n=1 Tax=Methylobacterium sp. J-030 TaxID=2836627 RepID=UPI001FBAF1F6
MPSPLSVDLRERVVAALAGGASFHRVAARFGVSVSSASRWSQQFAQQGHVAPKPTHSDDSRPAIEAHADLIL